MLGESVVLTGPLVGSDVVIGESCGFVDAFGTCGLGLGLCDPFEVPRLVDGGNAVKFDVACL